MTGYAGAAITIVGLLRIDAPGRVIRLCDGAFCYVGSDKFVSSDPVIGTLAGFAAIDEEIGDSAPDGSVTFLPPADVSRSQVLAVLRQNVRMRFSIGEIASDAKTVINAHQLADVLIDTSTWREGSRSRAVQVDYISRLEKLFLTKRGNTLSQRFHQTIWPGEKGLNNTTGLQRNIAWGVENPTRGGSGGGVPATGTGGANVQSV